MLHSAFTLSSGASHQLHDIQHLELDLVAYEQLKEFTRGRGVGAVELQAFVAGLGLPEDARIRLEKLTPSAYTGLAEALARAL